MKWFLGSPRPGLIGLAVLFCALAAPGIANAAPGISVSPAPGNNVIAFGNQDILTAPTNLQYKTVTVSSVVTGSSLTVGTVTVTGSYTFYAHSDGCSGQVLPTGSSCTIVLAFDPDVVGPFTGTLTIPSDAAPLPITRELSGTGTAIPTFSPSTPSHGFAETDVFAGVSIDGYFRITNAGSTAMTITGVSIVGDDPGDFLIDDAATAEALRCTGATLAISGFCDIVARFNPTAVGERAATLKFDYTYSGGSGTGLITITGTGTAAKFDPSAGSINFGTQPILAGPKSESLTITNSGDHPLDMTDFTIEGADAAEFAIDYSDANTCDDAPIAPAATCTLPLTFNPSTSGAKSATLRVEHNDPTTSTPGQSTIALNGTGASALLTYTPGSVEFEPARDIFSGPGAASTVTITNSGNESMNVTSATLAGDVPQDFAITGGTCTGASPKTLAAGASCTYLVTFDPSDDGDGRTATLEVEHTGINSPTSISLAGLGLRPMLGVFPGELAFGSRIVGSGPSEPQWVRFENYGSGPLSFGEIVFAGDGAADYAFYSNDCTNRKLVPTEFCDIAIAFSPTAAGPRPAVLRMAHSALPHTVTDVPLSASAETEPPLQLKVVNPKRLRLRTAKTITYSVKCPATCTVTANANLLLPGKGKKRKRSTLGWKQITVQGGKTGKLTFKLAGGQRVALAKAARARKRVSVSATFSAWAVGYSEAAATRGFKLK